MTDPMIRDSLLLQKRELANRIKENYINRIVDIKKFNNPLIKVVMGPRRAGKSFFAIHVLTNLHDKFGYVNFDDEKLTEIKDYNEIIAAVNSIYDNPKFLMFDEIQNLKNWELFVNRLQRQGFNLLITGSNSTLLSKELATHLTGRHIQINIMPFSFKESLETENKELTTAEIKEKLNTYIIYGGYPEPLIKNLDYKEYLSSLFDAIIYKDITKRFKIRNINAIENLATYLISNVTSEFSFNTLTKLTKCKSSHTIEKYLKYLNESFIFFEISRFSYKLKEQVSSNKKIYCIDNGFIHAKAFKFSQDLGKLYENIIAIHLKKLEINKIANIYYWKNPQQEEVDFVIKEGNIIKELIQVCHNTEDLETKKREIRALLKAGKELKCKNLIIITSNYEAEEKANWFDLKEKIKFIPLWRYLIKE